MRRRSTASEERHRGATMAVEQAPAEANKLLPPHENSVFGEAILPLIYSGLVYDISEVIEFARNNNCAIKRPEGFPDDVDLTEFMSKSTDFKDFNDGNGMSLSQLLSFVSTNIDAIAGEGEYYRFLVDAAKGFANHMEKHEDDDHNDSDHEMYHAWINGCFLRFHRSLRGNKACVYSVFKDTLRKKITIVYRGSTGPKFFNRTTRDWTMNFKYYAAPLWTPDAVKDKMKGVLKDRVLVHRGFRDYIWDNEHIEGPQRAEMLYNDMMAAIDGDEGYSVCVSGHSLGGALATMSSFVLAGLEHPDIPVPKPITCITFAAPYSGTYGYRLATEHLEKEGLLRSVRFNLPGDGVPKVFPCSIGWPIHPFRPMKHTGINVRMTNKGCIIEHSSRANFFTAIRNGLLQLGFWLGILKVADWHQLTPQHIEALTANEETLKKVTIEDLYNDETVVSKKFLDGNF